MAAKCAGRGCREPLDGSLGLIDLEGHAEGVAVVGQMHVSRCQGGHTTWVDPDYGSWFIAEFARMVEDATDAAPRRKGLRRTLVCPSCGSGPLGELSPDLAGTFDVTVAVNYDLATVDWKVTLPGAACAGCGHTAVWYAPHASPLADAVIDAMGRAGLAT